MAEKLQLDGIHADDTLSRKIIMRNQNIFRNIALAFLFFLIGRVIVFKMGNTGIYIIFGLVISFYLGWWLIHRLNRDKDNQ